MIGLFLSALMSAVNVLTDVSRKKVLDRSYDAVLISFWCKVIAIAAFGGALGALWLAGTPPGLPDLGQAFARMGINLPTPVAFVLYLAVNALLEGSAIVLNLRALQISPISYCLPFIALTPLFLLPAGMIFLGEKPVAGMTVGVVIVVVGSLVVNRALFANGVLEPAKAILRNKGSRYMLCVSVLLTFTNVLDKWFVSGGGDVAFAERLSRSITLSFGKGVLLALFFLGLTIFRFRRMPVATRPDWLPVFRDVPRWIVLAGVFEAIVLVLQLTAMQFTVAALVISIKRSGIVLAVFLGWLIFKERNITDRVIASFVMLCGVLIFFLTKPDANGHALIGLHGALAVAGGTLAVLMVVLWLTHPRTAAAKGES